MKKTKVISGFPGIGKSMVAKYSHHAVLDSDSSAFSWIQAGERHPSFPENYIQHIRENIGKVDYILVSSHSVVRKALEQHQIPYTLVYPSIETKKEYLKRYEDRGNNEGFVAFINGHWEDFIRDLETESYPKKIRLHEGEYLSDVLGLV